MKPKVYVDGKEGTTGLGCNLKRRRNFMENLKPETRAGVLVEALPYLQEYNGKIVVVKYGGNAMINEDLKQAVIRDIVL